MKRCGGLHKQSGFCRPLTGARIETIDRTGRLRQADCRPLTGARIETLGGCFVEVFRRSPPHGGAD